MTHCILKKNYQLPIVLVRSRSKKKRTGSVKKRMATLSEKPRKGSVVVTNKKADIVPNKLIFGLIITNFTDFFGAQILRTVSKKTNTEEINFIVKISYGALIAKMSLIQELIEMGIQGFDPTADHHQNIPRQKS